MTFQQAIQSGFKNYAKFEGRSTRSEYWWFILFYWLVLIVPSILSAIIRVEIIGMLLGLVEIVAILGMLIPLLAVAIRRLHDTERSGWWLLIGLIPIVGGVALLVFYCLEGTPGPNKYGSKDNVKAIADAFS